MTISTKEEKKLIKLYKTGMKTKDIAAKLDVSQGRVTSKIYSLQRSGVIGKRYGTSRKLPIDKPLRMNSLNYIPEAAKKHNPISNLTAASAANKTAKQLGMSQVKIVNLMDELKAMLLAKNAQYGDSALQPVRVFSKADTTEQIKVRIDDKINRIVQGNDSMESDEDVIQDLIGYLVLLLINMRE